MLLPADSVIVQAKLVDYLLKFQAVDDKSKFLAQAGYRLDNVYPTSAGSKKDVFDGLQAIALSLRKNRIFH